MLEGLELDFLSPDVSGVPHRCWTAAVVSPGAAEAHSKVAGNNKQRKVGVNANMDYELTQQGCGTEEKAFKLPC